MGVVIGAILALAILFAMTLILFWIVRVVVAGIMVLYYSLKQLVYFGKGLTEDRTIR